MSQHKLEEDLIQNRKVTWDGCSVLLDINDGDRLSFARLSPGSTLKIGNMNYSLKPLIGCPFGSVFQIENGENGPYLSRVLSTTQGNSFRENSDCAIKDECRDNRTIVDNNTAQNLTGEDIDAMRSEGATADEIVKALIANSTTFDKKTVFSQEKYKLKKQKKYAPKVVLRRPFARSICETYFKKYPAKIGHLRVDTLSLILTLANVGSGSDVLVFDMVCGILTGAVAERLGGLGSVCNTYFGNVPYPMEIVRIFNFSNEISEKIVRCSSTDLQLAPKGTAETINIEKNSAINETLDIAAKPIASPGMKAYKFTKSGEKASKEAIALYKENGFSSLIIAAPEMNSWKIAQDLLPLLCYSAPFVIYHQYLEPLSLCMHNLQLGKMAIGMQISESWLREYQVLPSRTHPCMQMSGFGGYILSGTRIHSIQSPP